MSDKKAIVRNHPPLGYYVSFGDDCDATYLDAQLRQHRYMDEDERGCGGTYFQSRFDADQVCETWNARLKSDTPKTWGEMTDAEKGALLLAQHEGRVIEFWSGKKWIELPDETPGEDFAYRIRPEPKRETVVMPVAPMGRVWSQYSAEEDGTHRITFDTIDGQPDCDSIRMEPIK